MYKNRPQIGIIAGYSLSPNMKVVLYNLGRMLGSSFEFHLVVGNNSFPQILKDKYKLYRGGTFRIDPARIRYAWTSCKNYVDAKKPDMLMNIGQSTLAYAVASIGHRKKIPTLVRITGDLREAGLGCNPWERIKSRFLHGTLPKRACRKADRVLVVGKNSEKSLIKLGIEPGKIFTLPQPFDPSPFEPLRSEAKSDLKKGLGLEAARKTILFVGRLSWLKGADRLKRIVEQVAVESSDFQFCLVGSGEYTKAFEKFPEELVHIAGQVTHDEVVKYYQASDLLVFPSRTEGLPNVILEALASELPVIASPIGEIPNYVSTTSQDVDEYVKYILQGGWKCDPLPDYFTWENQKRAYEDLFKSVLKIKTT